MALQISGASFALLYRRTNSKSIDSTEVWTTLADALAYAANTDDVKYVPIDGLVISVTENNKTYRLVPDESISTEDGKKHYKLEEIALAKDIVSKNLFSSIFGLIDENGNELSLYDDNVIDLTKSIKAKFGLWTELYLSALGMNPADGEVSLTLASLNDVLFSELTEGLSIVWNGTKWINLLIESGGLDESLLEDYLSRNDYATALDITDAISSKVDTTTFNSTISDLNTSISGIETLLGTKASKDELGTAVSTINTRIDGVVTDLDSVDKDLQDFKGMTETELLNLNLKKLDVDFFNAMFGLMDGDGLEITPNSTELDAAASIKAKFGIWTNEFLSAKGLNPDDGEITGLTLGDLSGVYIVSPQDGESLVYQQSSGQWINQKLETGNPFNVWLGESEETPTLNNKPASEWVNDLQKEEHVDDYYVTTKGLVYLFTKDSGQYRWLLVSDKYLIDCWNKLNLFDDDLTERVESLEAGSATNILSVGVGNVVTDVTKSGTVITVNKDISVYTKSEIDTKVNNINLSITSVSNAVSTEAERAKSAEATLTTNLNAEITRAKAAEQTLTTNLNNEISRAKAAELAIDDKVSDHIDLFNSMFLLVTSDGVTSIKAMHGLWTEQFLSAKGANTNGGGSSGGGLITSLYRYADLGKTFSDTNNDTFNAYTINKINADLGSRISVLEGKATNVSFTQSLTSGTQIGSISIDGVAKNIYAPTIPTDDINKGVTAYGWGNHASAGYLLKSGGTIDGNLQIGKATNTSFNNILLIRSGHGTKINNTESNAYFSFGNTDTSGYFTAEKVLMLGDNGLLYSPNNSNFYDIIHSNNYTDYTYSKSTIDTKLGGYLPLSGGKIEIITDEGLSVNRTNGTKALISFKVDGGYKGGLGIDTDGVPLYRTYAGGINTLIHSGNIGSQSVASAAKLSTARSIWGQSFNGENDVSGHLTGASSLRFGGDVGLWQGNLWSALNSDDIAYNAARHVFWGNVLIGTTTDSGYKLDVSGNAYFNSYVAIANNNGLYFKDNAGTIRSQFYIDQYNNTSIGYGAAQTSGNTSIYGTDIVFHSSADRAERVRILSNGNVGIGTTSPQYKLDVNGALNAGVYYASTTNSIGKNTSGHFRWGKFDEVGGLKLQFGAESGANLAIINSAWNKALFVVDTEGNVTASGTIHSNIGIFSDGYVSAKGQNTSSDMRLKNVLNDVVLKVSDIANAPSIRFAWKNGGGIDVGSSAQYWQVLLPDAVKERDGMLEMQYANIALLSAIALAKNFETHEERIARLESTIKNLQHTICILRNNVND